MNSEKSVVPIVDSSAFGPVTVVSQVSELFGLNSYDTIFRSRLIETYVSAIKIMLDSAVVESATRLSPYSR